MTGDALATSFEALLTGFTVYKGKVSSSPTYPHVLVLTNFPTVSERSMARTASARALRSRTLVVGLTPASVRIIAQKLTDALEGKRPAVDGWALGAIESVPNEQPIYHDRDVILPGTSDSPFYQTFDWILTGSPTP
ncbi:hypothetical protein ACLKOZ_17075 [Arthrobacter sp. R4]|uniref:hypothetical protein n=1 Tax=Arthrobacter sp. R4 TaxID=644417 RepID=UPI003ED9F679